MCVKSQILRKYMSDLNKRDYDLKPIQIGCEVRGIDLKTDIKPQVISQIKDDVLKHRLLVFKDQGIISGERQVEISKWLGEVESDFDKHPKSPHPSVFRISNSPDEGIAGVEFNGWHIDGTLSIPFQYALYHIVGVPRERGGTHFAPTNELIDKLPDWKKDKWDRIWVISDEETQTIHPLIFRHLITRNETLCFHPGMTSGFIRDYGMDTEEKLSPEMHLQLLNEIQEEFQNSLQYEHKWEEGDLILADNLALAHKMIESPLPEVGLKILHRTRVKGVSKPGK